MGEELISGSGTDTAPILLFGMPRSGTTWVGKILDSHPRTVYRHEPDSWRRLDEVPLVPVGATHQYHGTIRGFWAGVGDIRAPKVCGKLPVFPKNYLTAMQLACYRAGIRLSQLAGKAGLDLPVICAAAGGDGRRIVWKSIESTARFGLVLDALPQARGLLLIRHPCGYVASVLRGEARQKFEDNRGASEDYGIFEMLLETPFAAEKELTLARLRSLTGEERLAWRWALTNVKAMREVDGNPRCKVMIYDDACDDPLTAARSMYEHLQLDWSTQTEQFVRASTGEDQNAYYGVYRDPAKAARKWQTELPADTIERIMAVCRQSPLGEVFN